MELLLALYEWVTETPAPWTHPWLLTETVVSAMRKGIHGFSIICQENRGCTFFAQRSMSPSSTRRRFFFLLLWGLPFPGLCLPRGWSALPSLEDRDDSLIPVPVVRIGGSCRCRIFPPDKSWGCICKAREAPGLETGLPIIYWLPVVRAGVGCLYWSSPTLGDGCINNVRLSEPGDFCGDSWFAYGLLPWEFPFRWWLWL